MIVEFLQSLSTVDWILILQSLLACALVFFLWKAQHRDDFDWADIVKNRYGKVDPYVVTYLIAFGVYTYIVIFLARTGVLKEMYVVLYLAYGLGMPFAKSVLGAWRPPGSAAVTAPKE